MSTIYGPYTRKQDGRMIIIVNGKTISYPKYLYEQHYNIKIEEPYTIDHIDGDFTNNSISNLRVITRKQNAREAPAGRTIITLICAKCGKEFKREKRFAPRKLHWKAYCSTTCKDLS